MLITAVSNLNTINNNYKYAQKVELLPLPTESRLQAWPVGIVLDKNFIVNFAPFFFCPTDFKGNGFDSSDFGDNLRYNSSPQPSGNEGRHMIDARMDAKREPNKRITP